MHIYGKDQQAFHLQRTRVEKYFSRLNAIIVAMQLACWLCSIIRVAMNAGNSMSNSLYGISKLQLKSVYTVPGCVYNVTRTHAFFNNVHYQLSPETVQYYVSRSAVNLRYLWALTGVYTVVSIVNRLFFETNTHELRYHFAIFRKDTLTTWEVLLLVMGIVMTFGVNAENEILQDYIIFCSGLDALPKQYYNSVPPFVELYVMYFISLGFFVINAIVAIWNLSKENPRDKLLREDEKKRLEWLELMRKYQQPIPGLETSNSNTPINEPSQRVTYGGNVASVGGPNDPLMDTTSPPPALRRPPANSARPGPPPPPPGPEANLSANYGDSALYANRLPSRGPVVSPPHAGLKGSQGTPSQLPLSHHSTGFTGGRSRPHTPPLESHRRDGQNRMEDSERDANGAENSNGGRYNLREVYDDGDDGDVEDIVVERTTPNFSSVDEPNGGDVASFNRQGTNYSGASNRDKNSPDDARGNGGNVRRPIAPPAMQRTSEMELRSGPATPLLATRNAVIPPPPPVAIASDGSNNNNHGGHRPGVSKMLAPPSPLNNNGGDTTTDTIHL